MDTFAGPWKGVGQHAANEAHHFGGVGVEPVLKGAGAALSGEGPVLKAAMLAL